MGVTRLLFLGPFYSIQTNFLYFFAHDCSSIFTDLKNDTQILYGPSIAKESNAKHVGVVGPNESIFSLKRPRVHNNL